MSKTPERNEGGLVYCNPTSMAKFVCGQETSLDFSVSFFKFNRELTGSHLSESQSIERERTGYLSSGTGRSF